MSDLRRIATLFERLLFFNLIMLTVIIVIFPEPFSCLKDPISWLGKMGPGNGLAFYRSYWLFSAVLMYNAFRWNQITTLVLRGEVWRKLLVRIAFRAVLVGFLMMLFPCDRVSFIHDSGGALVGLGMWAISAMMLFGLNGILNSFSKTVLHLILHSSALFCIISFAINSPLKGFSQRPAILAIAAVILICLHLHLKTLQKPGQSV